MLGDMRCLPWSGSPAKTIWMRPTFMRSLPPEIPVPASPERDPRTDRKTRNGTIHKPRQPKPVLAAGPSAVLRDQLIAELQSLKGGDDLALWAYRRLPAKNTLTVDDARAVEAAYQAVLDGSDERRPGVPASASDPHAKDCPVAPAQDVANAMGQSTPRTKDYLGGRPKLNRGTTAEHGTVRALSKTIRLRDPEHRKFVARQPCLICGRTPVDAHHLRFAQPRAMGRKVSDEFTVPLCRLHHRELHRVGDERVWWKTIKIDPLPVALKLWRRGTDARCEEGKAAPATPIHRALRKSVWKAPASKTARAPPDDILSTNPGQQEKRA